MKFVQNMNEAKKLLHKLISDIFLIFNQKSETIGRTEFFEFRVFIKKNIQ